jgi:hypothetical protein
MSLRVFASSSWTSAAARFDAAAQFPIDGEVSPLGTLIRRPDLAATLAALAQ